MVTFVYYIAHRVAIITHRVNTLSVYAALVVFAAFAITAYFVFVAYPFILAIRTALLSCNVIAFAVAAGFIRVAAAYYAIAIHAAKATDLGHWNQQSQAVSWLVLLLTQRAYYFDRRTLCRRFCL